MSIRAKLRRALARFRGDADGVAAVEFALVLPVMLLLYIGTVEAGSLISMDRRVQTVAATLGDLVSRSNTQLAACDLQDFFVAAAGIMTPYSTTPLQQIVTSVFVKADGTAKVEWSRPAGGAVAKVKDAPFDLPQEMRDISHNSSVIVSEASYGYEPITNLIYKQQIPLRRENFYLPRFGGGISVGAMPAGGC